MFKVYTGKLEFPRLIKHLELRKAKVCHEKRSLPGGWHLEFFLCSLCLVLSYRAVRSTPGSCQRFCLSRWGPFSESWHDTEPIEAILLWVPFLFPLKWQYFSFFLILPIVLIKERKNHTSVKQDKNFSKIFLKKLSFLGLNLTQKKLKVEWIITLSQLPYQAINYNLCLKSEVWLV